MGNEVDICNVALLHIGQQQQVTSGDGTIANANAGPGVTACKLLYPRVRDRLLKQYSWRWALRVKALYPATPPQASFIPGWSFSYPQPADCMRAQYVYVGARPGQPAYPLIADRVFGVTTVSMLPAINGRPPRAPFQTSGGYVFTDYAEAIPTWDDSLSYDAGTVVQGSDGQSYSSKADGNAGHDPTTDAGAHWNSSTVTTQAQLVYVAQITDASLYPEEFQETLEWVLAMKLSLAIATKPDLATMVKGEAEEALRQAAADEANSEEPDERPDARSISVRG